MQIPIRLYKRHDLDLIYLYNHKEFSLTKALKLALYGYVNKEIFFIDTPHDTDCIFSNSNKKSIYFRLSLNDDTDKDIIDFISRMPIGYRNSMIKNLFRQYISTPNILGYYVDINQADKETQNFNCIDFYEKSKTMYNYKTITKDKFNHCSVFVYKKKTSSNQKSLFDMNADELKSTIFHKSVEEIEEDIMKSKEKDKDLDDIRNEKKEAKKLENNIFGETKKSKKQNKTNKSNSSNNNSNINTSNNNDNDDDFDMFSQLAESMKSFM